MADDDIDTYRETEEFGDREFQVRTLFTGWRTMFSLFSPLQSHSLRNRIYCVPVDEVSNTTFY